ncbi:KRAB [Acanthosepion pharaonis]|uniref:KRAB n=1 Tax=Acanthosepion pharaonis TaxID=158019 RepID=A0A812DHQ0_ACAPH|nr:KRAB [Sepia pharaonis]
MEQLDSIATDVLHQFKSKIKEAICLFNSMPDCMKLEAVHFWKDLSVRIKFSSADQPPSDEDLHVVELEHVEEVVSSQVDGQITDGQVSDADTPGLMALAEKLRVVCSENKTPVECNGSVLSNDEEDVTETMFCYPDIDIVTCDRLSDKQTIKLSAPVEISHIYAKKDLSDDMKDCDDARKDELKKVIEDEEEMVEEETILDVEEMKDIAKTDLEKFQAQTENNPVLRKSKRIRIRKDKTDMYFDLELPDGDGPARLVNTSETDLNDPACVDALNIISKEVKATIQSRTSCRGRKKSLPRNSSGSYTCEVCGLQLQYMAALIVHRRRHSGEKPFTCSICGRGFTTKGNKLRHEKTHSGEKPYECLECKKRFTEKKSLKVHMRSHTGERPYKCKICGRGFAQTGILQTHIYLHTGHKGHLCDTCGKAFRQKSQLRLHQKRHLNHRTFQCPEPDCEASFFTKGDLQRHKLKHSGARPFLCNLCPKTFTRLQYLKEHLNQHTGIKPYSCKLCDLSFYDMSTYYRHVRRHKPDPEEDAASATVAATTAATATVIEAGEAVHEDPGAAVMTYIVTSAEVTEEERKALEQQAVVAAAAAAETDGQSHETHLATIPNGQGDGQTTEVYQITVDPSLITRDEQTGQQVVTTVDFSAINLLANATTQEYLSTTS